MSGRRNGDWATRQAGQKEAPAATPPARRCGSLASGVGPKTSAEEWIPPPASRRQRAAWAEGRRVQPSCPASRYRAGMPVQPTEYEPRGPAERRFGDGRTRAAINTPRRERAAMGDASGFGASSSGRVWAVGRSPVLRSGARR